MNKQPHTSRPEASSLFELEKVDIAYNNFIALKKITLRIHKGEKIILIGPSGAGKSTLLNKLYTMLPTDCAFIHQQYALVPQLSVFHNIYIGRLDSYRTLYNVLNLIRPQKPMIDEITPVLEQVGLTEKIFIRVGELSGGQQQRVAVGRALYRDREVLLADEPVASVDVHQGEAIMNIIMQTDKTVISSLHSVDFALRFGKRIIGLSDGVIIFDLPTPQVTDKHLTQLYDD